MGPDCGSSSSWWKRTSALTCGTSPRGGPDAPVASQTPHSAGLLWSPPAARERLSFPTVQVVLRAAFIFAGLAAVQRFKGVLLFFAVLLLYSSYSLLSEEEEEEDLSQA